MIDLTKFCGIDPYRPYLHKPFSVGDFSYGTNGHILVRVPRRDDVPENPEMPKTMKADMPMAALGVSTFAPPPVFTLPPVKDSEDGDCDYCAGRGHKHDCPDCECECEACNGTGTEVPEKRISASIGDVPYALRYIRMVLAFPGVTLASPDASKPLLFRFDGGEGALMPLSRPYINHVDIAGRAA